jgi:hypothetical protein
VLSQEEGNEDKLIGLSGSALLCLSLFLYKTLFCNQTNALPDGKHVDRDGLHDVHYYCGCGLQSSASGCLVSLAFVLPH